MNTRIRKRLALLLFVGLILPMHHGVIAQQVRNPRIVNDWCYPRTGDGGWTTEDICEVQIFDWGPDVGETYIGGHSPALAPDGLRVAYLADGLYVYDRINQTSALVTAGLPLRGPVSWSRDGAHLALLGSFEGASGLTQELVVIHPDGSNLTRLTHDVGFRGIYAWSPSGNAIAFSRDADGVHELYVTGANGSNLTRLTHNVGFKGTYTWSPSGNAIAFSRDAGGVEELYVMGADGSNPTRLTYGAAFRGAISWSPDGGRIAFDCGTSICAINRDGTNLVQLTPAGFYATSAIFSPVGGDIAFATSEGVSLLRTDGSIVAVAPGIAATARAWSPDGRYLALVREETQERVSACNGDNSPCGRTPAYTYAVKADGSGLITFGAYGTNPVWFVPLPGQPSAAFTTACTGRTCQFNAAGSFDPDGSIVSYEWKFGDGTTGSGPAPTHTYAHASDSNYSAMLIVTDGDGQKDVTRGRIFTIFDTRPVAFFGVLCTELTCAFDASSSFDRDGVISSYAWNFGDGPNGIGNGRTASYRYLAGGTYTVTLTVTDDANDTSTYSRPLTVIPPPPPPAPMHVGDLDGASTATPRSWNATVTIGIHAETHGGLAGAAVSGVWDDGSAGTCTTDGSGRCSVSRGAILRKTSSVKFTVTGAINSSFLFSPGANHDPDGDSNGTSIVIRRQ